MPTALAELARENQRFINGTVIQSRGDILAPKKIQQLRQKCEEQK